MRQQANILDPISDCLEPSVFDAPCEDNPRLKPVHLKWIKGTVTRVLEDNGVLNPERYIELVLTGSLTTYQYSPDSDCDISLFIDWDIATKKRGEIIAIMVGNVDGTTLPGTTHPMQCFVVPPDISKEDLYQVGLRSGYDLATNSWLVPPEKDRVHDVEKEENGFYVQALLAADKMERLLDYEPDKAVDYWHSIHKRRRADQIAGKGDFSESNIIYKMLNNRGIFPKLSEASGEYIARTAVTMPIRRKFVYDGDNHKLIIGELAPEEGATWSHNQLAHQLGADLIKGNTLAGTISQNNYVQYEGGGSGVKPVTYEKGNAALHSAVPDIEGILGHSYLPHSPWADIPPTVQQPLDLSSLPTWEPQITAARVERAISPKESVMYHVAPQSARGSIGQHGIDNMRSPHATTPANVIIEDPKEARAFAEFYEHAESQPWDMWEVDPTGLDLNPDPDYSDPILPERIKRLADTRPDDPLGDWETDGGQPELASMQSAIAKLTEHIAALQPKEEKAPEKVPRKLIINRDKDGRMSSIEEVP